MVFRLPPRLERGEREVWRQHRVPAVVYVGVAAAAFATLGSTLILLVTHGPHDVLNRMALWIGALLVLTVVVAALWPRPKSAVTDKRLFAFGGKRPDGRVIHAVERLEDVVEMVWKRDGSRISAVGRSREGQKLRFGDLHDTGALRSALGPSIAAYLPSLGRIPQLLHWVSAAVFSLMLLLFVCATWLFQWLGSPYNAFTPFAGVLLYYLGRHLAVFGTAFLMSSFAAPEEASAWFQMKAKGTFLFKDLWHLPLYRQLANWRFGRVILPGNEARNDV